MTGSTQRPFQELDQETLFLKVGDICAVVNQVTSTQDLLEISLSQILNIFGATRGSIFIFNPIKRTLSLKVALGMKKDEEKKLVKCLGEGVVGKVAELKQPIVVDDISLDDRFNNFQARKSYQTPSFICAPLIIKDTLIGVVNISDKVSKHRFTKKEMQLLDFITSQVALNYRRVQLYRKFKTIVKETQSLKNKLGQSDEETQHLKKQVSIQEKLASIGKLAGGIAHEFNNPLDGVMRYTNLCLEHIKDDEVVREYLLEIKHGLARMANIVKSLLACSRNEEPRREKTPFGDALERTLQQLQRDLIQCNITIHQNIDNNMPLMPDFGIERILSNLLRNAIDAIDKNGEITIQAHYLKPILTIAITDSGKGIEAEKIETIFEPFVTTKNIEKGCGLGLTIVSEIVKVYNGKIVVESSVGEGTTFTINLPLESE